MKRARDRAAGRESKTSRLSCAPSSSVALKVPSGPDGDGEDEWLASSVFYDFSALDDDEGDDADALMSPRGIPRSVFLQRSLSIKELDDDVWLSSSFLDLVLSKIANKHHDVHFLSCDFAVFSLGSSSSRKSKSSTSSSNPVVKDIRGHIVNYAETSKPIVFIISSNGIHWNLVQVLRNPSAPRLEIFEPMGKPVSRHGGLSYRNVPQAVISWLDLNCPLSNGKKKESWISKSSSAILSPQQLNGVDCGVACLLYAEKCGQGQSAHQIDAHTNQTTISEYRILLKQFLHQINS